MSADLFGFEPPRAKFTDIRNQRESIAEEKARLCMELNELCRTPPPLARRSVNPGNSRLARRAQGCAQDAMRQGCKSAAAPGCHQLNAAV